MAKPLPNDLRLRLIDYVQSGLSARSAGRKLSISASAATAIVKRWRTTGSCEALQMGGLYWRRIEFLLKRCLKSMMTGVKR